MKRLTLGASSLESSQLAYGCWRIAGTWEPSEVTPVREEAGRRAVLAAYEAGYTLFDHADIYCDGVAERLFGQVLQQVKGMRAQILIATKCGIRKPETGRPYAVGRYDFSAEHIIRSCEQSLQRLQIETIDLYQLHRPDYLMDPTEVATAFARLRDSGKVREFGVSNFRPSQVSALQKACPMPLLVNQVEISLAHREPFEDGTLDQCLTEKITPMAWSPLAGGHLADGARRVLPSQANYAPEKTLLPELDRIAQERGVVRMAVALAWLLKHPSKIVPILGTIDPDKIKKATAATDLELTREEWYRLLIAAQGEPLP
jgi:predicted oxidoreductase